MPVSFDESNGENVPSLQDVNLKRKFLVRHTPHPHKKLCSMHEDDDADAVTPTDDSGMSRSLFLAKESPPDDAVFNGAEEATNHNETGQPKESTDDDSSPQDDDIPQQDNDDSWWEAAAFSIRKDVDSEYCTNLVNFQEHGIDRRVVVRDRLMFVMDEIKSKLDAAVERATTTLAGQLYEQYAGPIQQQQADILALVQSNHAKRVAMVDALEKANASWETKYTSLMNRLVFAQEAQDESPRTPKESGGATAGSPMDDTKNHCTPPAGNLKDESEQEIDWEEIIRLAPHSEDGVRSFLQARDQWKAVEEQYMQAIEGYHERLQANVDRTMNVVFDAFQAFDEDLDEQQFGVMKLMASNHERRQHLEEMLRESAQKATKMFERLMGRIFFRKNGKA